MPDMPWRDQPALRSHPVSQLLGGPEDPPPAFNFTERNGSFLPMGNNRGEHAITAEAPAPWLGPVGPYRPSYLST